MNQPTETIRFREKAGGVGRGWWVLCAASFCFTALMLMSARLDTLVPLMALVSLTFVGIGLFMASFGVVVYERQLYMGLMWPFSRRPISAKQLFPVRQIESIAIYTGNALGKLRFDTLTDSNRVRTGLRLVGLRPHHVICIQVGGRRHFLATRFPDQMHAALSGYGDIYKGIQHEYNYDIDEAQHRRLVWMISELIVGTVVVLSFLMVAALSAYDTNMHRLLTVYLLVAISTGFCFTYIRYKFEPSDDRDIRRAGHMLFYCMLMYIVSIYLTTGVIW